MCLNPLPHGLLNERTFDARNQFENLFSELLNVRLLANHQDSAQTSIAENRICSRLQAIALQHTEQLFALARHEQFSRHIIGTDGSWMGYVICWEPNAQSSIHGHPDFAYYQVIEGNFLMDLYNPVSPGVAEHTGSTRLKRVSVVWQQGERGRYDNLVHRVKTSDEPGFTLHLFSDDPCRGQHFRLSS